MKISLIPVIEIGFENNGIEPPNVFPYWQNAELYDIYRAKCYEKAGFQDKLMPYLSGSSFYELTTITDANLIKITKEHTAEMRNGDYKREQAFSFFGGYVLNIDCKDVYFPQCCGGLCDIVYWENLSNGEKKVYEGHPEPSISFSEEEVILNFCVNEFDEIFQPPIHFETINLNKKELKKAVEIAKNELEIFGNRLQNINIKENLMIEAIAKLLIYNI